MKATEVLKLWKEEEALSKDETLTPSQRADHVNNAWLCQQVIEGYGLTRAEVEMTAKLIRLGFIRG